MRYPLAILLILALSAVPSSAQDLGGTSRCTQECTPEAVNPNGIVSGKDPVRVILYPHFNDIQRAPINTEVPPFEARDENQGFSTVPYLVLPQDSLHIPSHQFIFWSTAGPVCYDPDLGGAVGCHEEHGLADDVTIADDEIILYFYLSAHALPGHSSKEYPEVGVAPRIALFAQMETGRHSFSSQSTVIARGDSGAGDARIDVISLPTTEEDVYEFRLSMQVENNVISAVHDELKGGYVVTVIPYQVRTEDWSAEATQADWRVRTGHPFLPRVIIPMEEPLKTTYSWMNQLNDRLYLRWSIQADLGSYDIDPLSMDLVLQGPTGPVDPGIIDFETLKINTDHCCHFVPANQTWGLNHRKVPLADGEYTATGIVQNLQHTYELKETWTFTVRNGVPDLGDYVPPPTPGGPAGSQGASAKAKPSDTPGFEAAGLLGGLLFVAAALASRRR